MSGTSARARIFRTSQVARILGLHPNTIRQWEAWGLLPAVERTVSGYRCFTRGHLDQLKVIRGALGFSLAGGEIGRTAKQALACARERLYPDAFHLACRLEAVIGEEHGRAKRAAELARRWAGGETSSTSPESLRRKAAAEALSVTRETLRTWERNGLLAVPRDPVNGYRYYGPEELDRLEVIRALRNAGYSMMAIHRMFSHLERGGTEAGIEWALDTPTEPEDLFCATNYWLTTLDTLIVKSARFRNLLIALTARHETCPAGPAMEEVFRTIDSPVPERPDPIVQ